MGALVRRVTSSFSSSAGLAGRRTILRNERFLVGRPSTLCFSTVETPPFDHLSWTENFLKEIEDVPTATDPYQSSQVLRELVKSKLLKFTDMRDDPAKFFLAHRLLSTVGLGGFGIRFTVQFNLFAGSIVGLGDDKQIAMLDEIQESGKLGCFLLTEMQAG